MPELRSHVAGSAPIRYDLPRPLTELRHASPVVIEAELRNRVVDLAAWFADIQSRGRGIGTLLASEAREHRKRLAEIEQLQKRRPIPMTTVEARRRLEGI